jgi:tellurite resistance protein TerC
MLLLAQTAVSAEGVSGGDHPLKLAGYGAFIVLVFFFLALDLGVFHRKAHEVSMKEAAIWSVVWVTLGVAFSGIVYAAYQHHWLDLGIDVPHYNPAVRTDPTAPTIVRGDVLGAEAAQQYLTGYVVEKSLSMDNIFVIALIFTYFGIPGKYQHRVLFWGIVGALVMRGGMIFAGAGLVMRYSWLLIVFGLFLLLTSAKMAVVQSHPDPGKNPVVRFMRRLYPVVSFYDGQRFFTRRTVAPTYVADPQTGELKAEPAPAGTLAARRALTPLALALVMVEITDLVFAVDSIPAVFAISPDPFVVFTSNIFAILGLRSLYFCLAALIKRFKYLKPALILILAFVGVKLLLVSTPAYIPRVAGWFGFKIEPMHGIEIDTTVSLSVVLGVLALAVVASVIDAKRREGRESKSEANAHEPSHS